MKNNEYSLQDMQSLQYQVSMLSKEWNHQEQSRVFLENTLNSSYSNLSYIDQASQLASDLQIQLNLKCKHTVAADDFEDINEFQKQIKKFAPDFKVIKHTSNIMVECHARSDYQLQTAQVKNMRLQMSEENFNPNFIMEHLTAIPDLAAHLHALNYRTNDFTSSEECFMQKAFNEWYTAEKIKSIFKFGSISDDEFTNQLKGLLDWRKGIHSESYVNTSSTLSSEDNGNPGDSNFDSNKSLKNNLLVDQSNNKSAKSNNKYEKEKSMEKYLSSVNICQIPAEKKKKYQSKKFFEYKSFEKEQLKSPGHAVIMTENKILKNFIKKLSERDHDHLLVVLDPANQYNNIYEDMKSQSFIHVRKLDELTVPVNQKIVFLVVNTNFNTLWSKVYDVQNHKNQIQTFLSKNVIKSEELSKKLNIDQYLDGRDNKEKIRAN